MNEEDAKDGFDELRLKEWKSVIEGLDIWNDEELNQIIMECQKLKRERRIEKFRQETGSDKTPAWRNG